MSSPGTPKVVVRLDPELRSQLEMLAAAREITLSDALREAILDYISKWMTI